MEYISILIEVFSIIADVILIAVILRRWRK